MRFILLFLFFIPFNLVNGQTLNQENEVIQVEYQCYFNVKFDREKQFYSYDARLYQNQNASYFFAIPDKNNNTSGTTMDVIIEADTFLRVVKNPDRTEILFGTTSYSGKEIFFRDSLFPMSWNLENEKKKIDSFECYKANTWFKGRKYIAWYCPQIPIPDGPWKLGGLPGLILEAYDENKDLYFIVKRIFNTSNHYTGLKNENFLNYPDYPAYKKYLKELFEKLQGAMSAQDSPDCVSCETKTKFNFYVWEKVLE